jgi:integrase
MGGWYVRKVAGVLRGVLSLAVKDRRLHSNPANDLNCPLIGAKRRRYLTSLQVEELADAAKAGRVVVLVLAYCGIRRSEVAALRVRHIDLLRRRLMIEEGVTEVNGSKIVWGTPKSHERRSVPIPRSIVAELATHVAGKSRDDLAFAAPGGGVLRNRNARRGWFDAAATAIGVTGLTPHELRHTAASLAVSAGANVKAVQRMLGHASAAVTLDIYADLFDDDLDAVADRLEDVRERTSSFRCQSVATAAGCGSCRTPSGLCTSVNLGTLVVGDTGIEPVTPTVSR